MYMYIHTYIHMTLYHSNLYHSTLQYTILHADLPARERVHADPRYLN